MFLPNVFNKGRIKRKERRGKMEEGTGGEGWKREEG